jgi:hypothetical protein
LQLKTKHMSSHFKDPTPATHAAAKLLVDSMPLDEIPGFVQAILGELTNAMEKIDSPDYKLGWGCAAAFIRVNFEKSDGSSIMTHASGAKPLSARAIIHLSENDEDMAPAIAHWHWLEDQFTQDEMRLFLQNKLKEWAKARAAEAAKAAEKEVEHE